MEEENKVALEDQETPEGDSNPQDEEIDVEELKKRASQSSQNFERAKKAEAELKKLQSESKPDEVSRDGLSNKDVIFLAKADIHEDDMDEVLDWAKFKKVPVSEAYKQLKATLQVRAEERKSAEVSNVSNVRRGTSSNTPEVLLERAQKGEVLEKDDDIRKALKAKMGIKK